jgi:glucokinase
MLTLRIVTPTFKIMKEVVLGIDIGGTSTKMGYVDREGNVLCNSSFHMPVDASLMRPEEFVFRLYETAQQLYSENAASTKILGIGIGAPNGNYYKGTIEFAANLPWHHEIIQLTQLFQKYYSDIPIKLTNDANAAALGEMLYGGAKGMKDFIFITLGTGLGSGFVSNGNLIYGQDGFAGEMGHITMVPNGRKCGCGREGCLETYVSATGVKQTAFELLAKHYFTETSLLKQFSYDAMTAKDIAEAAQSNDAIAKEVFEEAGEMLGMALANMVAITSPEAIFIYGGLANSGDLIMKPTRRSLDRNILKNFKKKDEKGNILEEANVKLILSELNNKQGAILGAAALAWKEILGE